MPGLHVSICLVENTARRHGGVKRSVQLQPLAAAQGFESINVPHKHPQAFAVVRYAPLSVLRMLPVAAVLGWRFLSLKGVAATLLYGAWLHAMLKRHRPTSVMMEVAPNRDIVLANVLASLKVPFTAWPHNVEFMVPGQHQSYFRSRPAAFAAELRAYRAAQSVQTISRFDAFVLRALGLSNVAVTPYEPPEEDRQALDAIREARRSSRKQGILMLGSIGNPPTREGMTRLLQMIAARNDGRRYVLAGYGTEALKPLAPPRVEVLGSVSADRLRDLMIQTEALLIYQPPTSGMLTRMVEAATAGIPTYVMGGYLQAQELAGRGVFPIDDLSELPAPMADPA
jgi:hypothetical protein